MQTAYISLQLISRQHKVAETCKRTVQSILELNVKKERNRIFFVKVAHMAIFDWKKFNILEWCKGEVFQLWLITQKNQVLTLSRAKPFKLSFCCLKFHKVDKKCGVYVKLGRMMDN